MNDKSWSNPWAAGAQLSHYLFFCQYYNQKPNLIEDVLQDLDKYKHPNGWYYKKTSDERRINGIMKVLTGFDFIGKQIEKKMAIKIIDSILNNNKIHGGGCSIYDLCCDAQNQRAKLIF